MTQSIDLVQQVFQQRFCVGSLGALENNVSYIISPLGLFKLFFFENIVPYHQLLDCCEIMIYIPTYSLFLVCLFLLFISFLFIMGSTKIKHSIQ